MNESAFSQTGSDANNHIKSITSENVQLSPEKFSVCHHYGCNQIQEVSIDSALWEELSEDFKVKSHSSYQERAYIAEFIGRMETIVGRMTNTQYDNAGTFLLYLDLGKAKSHQMDCIDESINSFSYLKLLENELSLLNP